MSLQIANLLSPKTDYTATALDAIGHLFGRNYFCRSFVTGLGLNGPMHPHDRRSIGDSIVDPWPGYLVGGGWPQAKSWVDIDTNYQTNEIAINWQGALIYALAGFISQPNSRNKTAPGRAVSAHNQKYVLNINGLVPLTLPAGDFVVYNSQGRMVTKLNSNRTIRFTSERLGLKPGIFIVKVQKTALR